MVIQYLLYTTTKRDYQKHFSKNISLVADNTGKVGLLDADNNFFYGIDTKGKKFPIVGTNMDMTLLLKGKEKSIVPYFDFNSRPSNCDV